MGRCARRILFSAAKYSFCSSSCWFTIPVTYADAMQLGTNVVALGNERVLVPASSKNLIAACRAEGLTVYDPDVSMIGNGGGAVHCMCQALRRDHVKS